MNRVRIAVLTALAVLVSGLVLAPSAEAVRPPLTVRVSDLAGSPGDVVALVLRTLSARPIRQGRISVRPRRPRRGRAEEFRAPTPFLALEGYEVFANRNDAVAVASLKDDADGQLATLQFSSASGSVNRKDGPLAVLYLRLGERLQNDDEFVIEVQADTQLEDVNGQPVPLELLAGVLMVQPQAKRDELQIDTVDTEVGEEARFGIQSLEPRALGSGTLVIRYDPSISEDEPKVRLNSKYGTRRFTVDTSVPGRVAVDFESPGGDFNTLPGEILSVELETRETLTAGTRVPITFDRAATILRDPSGVEIPYRLRDGALRIVAEEEDDSGNDDGEDGDDGDDPDDPEDPEGPEDPGDPEDPEDPEDAEFDALAITADAATGLIGLEGGTIVLVVPGLDWEDGDFASVAEVSAALQAGKSVRVRGSGALNEDGVLVADEIEAIDKS